jgi:hypothetical protein
LVVVTGIAAPFVGRGTELDALAGVLAAGSGVIAQAVAGLGGVGKTELALRHAWACRDRYRLVWWVTADTPANIQAGLAALAYRLVPVLQTATTAEQAAGWAVGWLQTHPGALLLLDNVEQPADTQQLLGQLAGTHVLVTIRRDLGWQRFGLTPVRLGVLAPPAAADLLLELTGEADPDAAAGLAADLGHLPLALDQAAAYITQHRTTLAAYRHLLATDPGRTLTTPAEGNPTDRAVARVWTLTRAAIDARLPLAGRLLDILAWLGPDLLPRDVLAPRSRRPHRGLRRAGPAGLLQHDHPHRRDRERAPARPNHHPAQPAVRPGSGRDRVTARGGGSGGCVLPIPAAPTPDRYLPPTPRWVFSGKRPRPVTREPTSVPGHGGGPC